MEFMSESQYHLFLFDINLYLFWVEEEKALTPICNDERTSLTKLNKYSI